LAPGVAPVSVWSHVWPWYALSGNRLLFRTAPNRTGVVAVATCPARISDPPTRRQSAIARRIPFIVPDLPSPFWPPDDGEFQRAGPRIHGTDDVSAHRHVTRTRVA